MSGSPEPSPTSSLTPFRVRVACFLFLLLLAGALEGLLRGWGPGPRLHSQGVNALLWVHDPDLGFTNRKAADFLNDSIRSRPRVRTDSRGLRLGGPQGGFRGETRPGILFLGDSTTLGAEVEDSQTFPAQLALGSGNDSLWVANAGVRGYSTLQASLMLERRLQELEGVRLVIYAFTSNDLVENLLPQIPSPVSAPQVRCRREGSDLELLAPAEGALQAGEPFPLRPGPLRRFGWWLRRTLALADLGADLIHWLGPGSAPPSAPVPIQTCDREEVLQKLLRGMAVRSQEAGAKLLVTAFPGQSREALEGLFPRSGSLESLCRGAGADYLDPYPSLGKASEDWQAKRPWLGLDPHFSAAGNQAWARALGSEFRERLKNRGESRKSLPHSPG
jgi:hypothetical protein